ncbi:MAG: DNA repair protein RecN [Ignavibacteria bacterium]
MLKTLRIQDYALIEKVYIEFGRGLNIITGETGAGKSILIDAMGLLLGERASTEVVRKGAAKSVIEGIFDVENNPKVEVALDLFKIDFQPELIMRREISIRGSNRCFINDTPVSLAYIKEIGNLLVDIHGQHEHQSLLRTETHIEMLDDFANLDDELIKYQELHGGLNRLINELKSLREKEDILREKKELYSFQIREIDNVTPIEGEDEKLTEELKILENSEKLLEATSGIYQKIYDSENAVYDVVASIRDVLRDLSRIDKSFEEAEAECGSALELINDIAAFIRAYRDKIDIDPARVEEARARMGSLMLLKKKYGGSLAKVNSYRRKIGEESDLAENFEESMNEIERGIESARIKCGVQALKISRKRNKVAKAVQTDVKKALSHLGIQDAVFEVKITQTPAEKNNPHIIIDGNPYGYDRRGCDTVEFHISTNLGEDPKPLVKVASGGEISRIMLALKTILAVNDKLPLLIFDEIDTGVSGRIAQKVGQTLKSLAAFHQIISITHLPQIAGLADQHYVVAKSIIGERVVSSIKKLDTDDRIREVAKLMSGEEVTEASLKGARELMGI